LPTPGGPTKQMIELRDSVERDTLRAKYAEASRLVRESTRAEVAELDGLSSEGLGDE